MPCGHSSLVCLQAEGCVLARSVLWGQWTRRAVPLQKSPTVNEQVANSIYFGKKKEASKALLSRLDRADILISTCLSWVLFLTWL